MRKCLARKRCLWRQLCFRNNDPIVNHKYKECVSHWRYVTKQHHIQAEETLVDSKNLGSFYKFINKRISIVDQNGHMATDDYSKACTFNSYFASVGCSDNNCSAYPSRSTPCYIDSVNFQPNFVLLAINKLKNNFTCGPDGIPPMFFKQISRTTALPLSLIFN